MTEYHSNYQHLGPFSDLVAAAKRLRPLFPTRASAVTRDKAREVLGFTLGDEHPLGLRRERTWESGGIHGEELSWWVGFGPRTHSWIFRPKGGKSVLPGILALHDHGHYKFFGKEKIADGPEGAFGSLTAFRDIYYGGRAYANQLAREGHVVLVHDTFLWGSRKFPLEVMPTAERTLAESVGAILGQESAGVEIVRYNGAAYLHEHLVSKYCTLLGTSLAAIVAYEDRVALNYLRSRVDVDPNKLACVGLSGGGARAALLRATSDDLAACAIAGMMSTYDELLDHDVAPHTWMLFPPGWAAEGDWPDLAASAAPAPLLVQYLLDDAQFTVAGMRGADARMAARYAEAGARESYNGEFYPGPHRFDLEMQASAFAWLKRQLQ
jgi:dienelactone hydrolase